jgi:hypothetical protein
MNKLTTIIWNFSVDVPLNILVNKILFAEKELKGDQGTKVLQSNQNGRELSPSWTGWEAAVTFISKRGL